jgi:hypothetical protein
VKISKQRYNEINNQNRNFTYYNQWNYDLLRHLKNVFKLEKNTHHYSQRVGSVVIGDNSSPSIVDNNRDTITARLLRNYIIKSNKSNSLSRTASIPAKQDQVPMLKAYISKYTGSY